MALENSKHVKQRQNLFRNKKFVEALYSYPLKYPNLFTQKSLKKLENGHPIPKSLTLYVLITKDISSHTPNLVSASKPCFKTKYLPFPKLTVLFIHNTTTTKGGTGKYTELRK